MADRNHEDPIRFAAEAAAQASVAADHAETAGEKARLAEGAATEMAAAVKALRTEVAGLRGDLRRRDKSAKRWRLALLGVVAAAVLAGNALFQQAQIIRAVAVETCRDGNFRSQVLRSILTDAQRESLERGRDPGDFFERSIAKLAPVDCLGEET